MKATVATGYRGPKVLHTRGGEAAERLRDVGTATA